MHKEPVRKELPKQGSFLNAGIRNAHERLKELLKDPVHREVLKSRIRRFKKEDKSPTSYPQYRGAGAGKRFGHTPLSEYYAFYYKRKGETRPISFLDLVKLELTRKKFVRVLDAGAGYGQALSELKKELGDKVETHALVLNTTSELQRAHQEGRIDKVHQAEISTFLPKQEYDIIISFYGGIRYTPQREVALKKLLHSLAVDGVAYIQIDLHDEDFEVVPILKRFAEENPNFSVDLNTFYEAVIIRRNR